MKTFISLLPLLLINYVAAHSKNDYTGTYHYYNDNLVDNSLPANCCLPASPVELVEDGPIFHLKYNWTDSEACKTLGFVGPFEQSTQNGHGMTIISSTNVTKKVYINQEERGIFEAPRPITFIMMSAPEYGWACNVKLTKSGDLISWMGIISVLCGIFMIL